MEIHHNYYGNKVIIVNLNHPYLQLSQSWSRAKSTGQTTKAEHVFDNIMRMHSGVQCSYCSLCFNNGWLH